MSESRLTELAPDLYQLRLPLPFALNHVQVYLLRGTAGWTVVDTGINWQAGRAGWQMAFDTLGFTPADIEKIVLTHMHPDHFGLAGWLVEAAAAHDHVLPVYASPQAISQLQRVWLQARETDLQAWLQQHGMSATMAATVNASMGDTHAMTIPHPLGVQALAPATTVMLGQRPMQVIHAPGHSDGQLIFYDAAARLLLSADHVLLTITPNIGLWEFGALNPLDLYLTSLRSVQTLDVTLALPGHRRLIEDWRGRVSELLHHHDERLHLTRAAVQHDHHTPYTVAGYIFDTTRFSPHEWRFALAETLAHLAYLQQCAELVSDDGAYYLP